MADFTLDTSGAVPMGAGENMGLAGINLRWSDLTPFVQGYVEAALRDFDVIVWPNNRTPEDTLDVRFSDLASETLAAMLKACEAWRAEFTGKTREASALRADMGREFWRIRQEGKRRSFPPVALHLGDDGKVYLKPQP